MEWISIGGWEPALSWAFLRSPRAQKPPESLLVLMRFCWHCRKTPARLLVIARTSKGGVRVLKMLERWLDSLYLRPNTKIAYFATVHDFFSKSGVPLPLTPLPRFIAILLNLKDFNGKIFASMLQACNKDPRMKSMLLVQLQSFSTVSQRLPGSEIRWVRKSQTSSGAERTSSSSTSMGMGDEGSATSAGKHATLCGIGSFSAAGPP